MPSEWEKVEMSPSWNGTNEDGSYKLKNGDELVGFYKGKEEGIGENNSTIYNFKTEKGMIGVWGSTVLDTRFKNLEVGEEVRVVYLGLVESKTKGRRGYHNFEVYHRKADFVKTDPSETEVNKFFNDNVPPVSEADYN